MSQHDEISKKRNLLLRQLRLKTEKANNIEAQLHAHAERETELMQTHNNLLWDIEDLESKLLNLEYNLLWDIEDLESKLLNLELA